MPEYTPVICGILGFSALIILITMKKSGHFFASFLISALSGIGSLFAVNLLTFITGVRVAVNLFSLTVCTFTGSCGSILLLLLNVLDKI